jgi:hypothetical protein
VFLRIKYIHSVHCNALINHTGALRLRFIVQFSSTRRGSTGGPRPEKNHSVCFVSPWRYRRRQIRNDVSFRRLLYDLISNFDSMNIHLGSYSEGPNYACRKSKSSKKFRIFDKLFTAKSKSIKTNIFFRLRQKNTGIFFFQSKYLKK